MDWNVIISVQAQGYKNVKHFLHEYGKVRSTNYFNVMIMQVEDIADFLEDMCTLFDMQTAALKDVGHIMPVTERFTFQTPAEFENKAQTVVAQWLDTLTGKHFFVRMHRRGFKGKLSSQQEERFLDEFILNEIDKAGKAPAKVDFSEPDFVIAVETLGQEAGLSLWSREQRERYPFLKLQ